MHGMASRYLEWLRLVAGLIVTARIGKPPSPTPHEERSMTAPPGRRALPYRDPGKSSKFHNLCIKLPPNAMHY
jgi:hypothetical protein